MNNNAGQIARNNAPRRPLIEMPAHLARMANTLPSKAKLATPPAPMVNRSLVTPKSITAERARQAEVASKINAEIERMKAQQEKIRAKLQDLTDYRRHPQRPKRLLKLLAKVTQIEMQDIFDTSRRQQIVPLRQIAMWIVHRNCVDAMGAKIGWCAMGRLFKRDHATVMHSVRKVNSTKRLMGQALDLELKLLMMEREIYEDNTCSEMVADGGQYLGDCTGA